MRAISGPLATAVAQPVTTLARLVDIKLVNGTVFYMTDSDVDITYAGHVYKAKPGCDPSQVRSVLGTSSESVTITTLIDPAGITSALIEAGSLDDARLRVLVIDFSNPSSSVVFFQGFVSTVAYKDKITASIVAQPLVSRDVALAQDVYCSNCRADLGDAKCKVDIEALKALCTVTNAGTLQKFVTDNLSTVHQWQAGLVVFTSGANNGFSFEVQDSAVDGTLTLRGIMPFALSVGDTLKLYPGCDKTIKTCRMRYNNILNFRGEPFAIAPWIATSQAPITTSSTTTTAVGQGSKRTLYAVHGYAENYKVTGNPEFGPVADVWGFSPAIQTSVYAGSGVDTYAGARKNVVCSAIGQVFVAGHPGPGGSTLPNFVMFDMRELTDAEATRVRATYPEA